MITTQSHDSCGEVSTKKTLPASHGQLFITLGTLMTMVADYQEARDNMTAEDAANLFAFHRAHPNPTGAVQALQALLLSLGYDKWDVRSIWTAS